MEVFAKRVRDHVESHRHGHDEDVDPGSAIVHALLMITAWGVLLPVGILIARFAKSAPRWWWFTVHRAVQVCVRVCACIFVVFSV